MLIKDVYANWARTRPLPSPVLERAVVQLVRSGDAHGLRALLARNELSLDMRREVLRLQVSALTLDVLGREVEGSPLVVEVTTSDRSDLISLQQLVVRHPRHRRDVWEHGNSWARLQVVAATPPGDLPEEWSQWLAHEIQSDPQWAVQAVSHLARTAPDLAWQHVSSWGDPHWVVLLHKRWKGFGPHLEDAVVWLEENFEAFVSTQDARTHQSLGSLLRRCSRALLQAGEPRRGTPLHAMMGRLVPLFAGSVAHLRGLLAELDAVAEDPLSRTDRTAQVRAGTLSSETLHLLARELNAWAGEDDLWDAVATHPGLPEEEVHSLLPRWTTRDSLEDSSWLRLCHQAGKIFADRDSAWQVAAARRAWSAHVDLALLLAALGPEARALLVEEIVENHPAELDLLAEEGCLPADALDRLQVRDLCHVRDGAADVAMALMAERLGDHAAAWETLEGLTTSFEGSLGELCEVALAANATEV